MRLPFYGFDRWVSEINQAARPLRAALPVTSDPKSAPRCDTISPDFAVFGVSGPSIRNHQPDLDKIFKKCVDDPIRLQVYLWRPL
jgi:hypothetical protein